MICNNCKNEIPNDSKFCEVCGTPVNSPQPQPAPSPQYQQVPPPAAPVYRPQPGPQQGPQYQQGYNQGYQQGPQYQQGQQYQQQRPQYQPGYNQAMNAGNPPPLTVGQYILMWLIMCIPLVNIIMLFVWAFSSTENANKKNYAKAILLMMLIMIGVYIVIAIIAFAIGGSIFSGLTDSFGSYGSF